MTRLARLLALTPLAMVGPLTLNALGQCPRWDTAFAATGVGGPVYAITSFDDGTGPVTCVGGDFDWVSGQPATNIACWDGSSWAPIGNNLTGTVKALAVYDAGSGPALYAGGKFSLPGKGAASLATWNGTSWVSHWASGSGEVVDLLPFDDGTGVKLYVARGNLSSSQIATVRCLSGTQMTKIGNFDSWPDALATYDDGTGDRLYATIGPSSAWEIQQWQGGSTWTNWEFVQGLGSRPYFLEALDLGNGPELFLGGDFTSVGGVPANAVAVLGPTNWAPLGQGFDDAVYALTAHDDGSGPALWAGGTFSASGATAMQNLARFDGSDWTNVGDAEGAVHDFGPGLNGELLVGGSFQIVDGAHVGNLGSWDGAAWSPLGTGLGFDGRVRTFEVFDDGTGPALFAGGNFRYAGTTRTNHLARWTGTGWAPVGSGLNGEVVASLVFDDGTGPALYIGGEFTAAGGLPAQRVARWTGTAWEPVGAGFAGLVNDLAVFDDGTGPALYAGGEFAGRIARWTGTGWALLPTAPTQHVYELLSWDDGTGEALYASGPFNQVGSLNTKGVARWDGTSWSALGAGLGPDGAGVVELKVWDDGTGERLYAGGDFTKSGSTSMRGLASWDGAAWSDVGGAAFDQSVSAVVPFDDGTGGGPALFVTGSFTSLGIPGFTGARLARWDGGSWSGVGEGLDDTGRALEVFDDGSGQGPALWIGGAFLQAGGVQGARIARYLQPCPQVGLNYCTAGTSASGCQAVMSASGVPSATAPSGFHFEVSQLEGQKTGLFLWASNGRQANPWGNGSSFICVVPPRYRSAVLGPSGTTGACDAILSTDMNARWQAKPNSNPGPGAVAQAQFWYRDPSNTSNQTSSLSDGLEFTVGP